MSKETIFALDRSMRRIDAEGRLHVEKSHISRAMVSPYYGKEIPGYEDLGLDPGKIYRLLRDPKALEAGAETFANIQILMDHDPVSADDPKKEIVVGTIGSKVEYNAPYLDADICIWDAEAIAGIESDKVRELSCAYRYIPVMEPGTFEGKHYDGRMTKIQGNHLALVESGRAGSDVIVSDSNPFAKDKPAMKMTKLGRALYVALSAASPVLAQDSALGDVVGGARKNMRIAEVKARVHAMDAEMSPEKMDAIIDAVIGVNDNPDDGKIAGDGANSEPTPENTPVPIEPDKKEPVAEDGDGAEKVRELLKGKVDEKVIDAICAMFAKAAPAQDMDVETARKDANVPVKKEEMKGAIDAFEKRLRDQYKALESAKETVREVVGTVSGVDTAAEVYGFALDHMSIDHKDITDENALAALCRVAMAARNPAPRVAMDRNTIETIPGLSRFGVA